MLDKICPTISASPETKMNVEQSQTVQMGSKNTDIDSEKTCR